MIAARQDAADGFSLSDRGETARGPGRHDVSDLRPLGRRPDAHVADPVPADDAMVQLGIVTRRSSMSAGRVREIVSISETKTTGTTCGGVPSPCAEDSARTATERTALTARPVANWSSARSEDRVVGEALRHAPVIRLELAGMEDDTAEVQEWVAFGKDRGGRRPGPEAERGW